MEIVRLFCMAIAQCGCAEGAVLVLHLMVQLNGFCLLPRARELHRVVGFKRVAALSVLQVLIAEREKKS